MHEGKNVFSQLVELLPQKHFQRLVAKYGGDRYVKQFSCWSQLLVMMFGQLYGCDSGVLCDQSIRLTGYQPKRKFPGVLRRIVYYSAELKRTFTYISNAFYIKAEDIAMLYKKRWQVELFFKWIKQHLYIKSFWGNSENAVRIQIYCAVASYCLVAIAEHDCRLGRSMFDVLRIIRGSLIDKTPIRELFEKPLEEKSDGYKDGCVQLTFDF